MDLLILIKNLGRKMQEKSLDNKPDVAAYGCNEFSPQNVFSFLFHWAQLLG